MKRKILSTAVALAAGCTLAIGTLHGDDFHKRFHDEIADFFNDNGFVSPPRFGKIHFAQYPKMNLFEDEKSYTFEYELAGIDKKDIKVEVSGDNILTVSGSKKELTKEEQKGLIRQERFHGTFTRSFSLPDDINKDEIKVSHENGILKVIVTKDKAKSKETTRVIEIE
jgi:HSP20 family protein